MAPGEAGRWWGRPTRDRHFAAQGERIYHLPNSRDYERTRINDRAGERMFCSEDEAKAAGWRAARG